MSPLSGKQSRLLNEALDQFLLETLDKRPHNVADGANTQILWFKPAGAPRIDQLRLIS